jgi:hypothetical protein
MCYYQFDRHGADWTLRDNWGRNSLELAETHNLKKSFQGNCLLKRCEIFSIHS